jgi:hypothetical protein
VSYQIRVKYPFFGGDKADGRWQKEKKTSAEKGVIKADLVSVKLEGAIAYPVCRVIAGFTRNVGWFSK